MMDERKLPDMLLALSGERIKTAGQWRQTRRQEILDLFREHVYGWESAGRPEIMEFDTKVTPAMMGGSAVRKQVDIRFEGPGGAGSIRMLLFLPSTCSKPCPAFLLLNNRGSQVMDPERDAIAPFWPAERMIARGYAAAVLDVEDADPDFHDGFRNGVHGIFDRLDGERPANAWGTIAAWAWAGSRAMDYLETDPDIDASRVAVVGHSRGGKAALWAGALDERFAFVVSNDSGCTGAAIARGKQGETIRNINDQFPHWFNGNYKTYNDREEHLPVDQHMLLALIAPRPLYVASASKDEWADPRSEFLSLLHAADAYRLFGCEALAGIGFPNPEEPLASERTGYHVRTGEHDLKEYDWDRFMDFADRHAFKRH
ncbi:acetylxylan esterase [Paenibacillus lycopersici]|uniref:Acetylxylan esterase n=1 Tax=Paenibacillus lycopersici TaxID=2704462 RepID=A0A6C0G168_9BACL|nr:acetylxylan esterase [Paenibacillus lycopersici]QHT60959.1 acetylxylan esterase [Paenibacillus lycopersici]